MKNPSQILNDSPRLEGSNTTKPSHDCNHTADFQRIYRWQDEHDEKEKQTNEQLKEGQEILKDIQKTVNRLDKNQALTEQQNGFQDKQIEGINQKEREGIRNKWVIVGIVVGALVGPIVIRLVELYTPL